MKDEQDMDQAAPEVELNVDLTVPADEPSVHEDAQVDQGAQVHPDAEVDDSPTVSAQTESETESVTETVTESEADSATDSSTDSSTDSAIDGSTDEVIGSSIGLTEARRAVEAMLMVADQPVPSATIAQLLELPTNAIHELCSEMAADYESLGHGFQLTLVAGGWRFQSHPSQAQYIERFALEGQVSRLSAAALETLAIVAYKQPISRAQIAQIRGVNVDGVMRTLTQRGYVAEIGTDPGPGQASLFGTTTKFLEGVGLGSLADLAPLADFVPGSEIMEALEAGLRVDTTVDTNLDTNFDGPAEQGNQPVAAHTDAVG